MTARTPLRPPLAGQQNRPAECSARVIVRILNPLGPARFTSLKRARGLVHRGLAEWRGKSIYFVRDGGTVRSLLPNATPAGNDLAAHVALTQARDEKIRARLLAKAQGSHTKEEWQAILARYGNRCLCCEVSGVDVPLTRDHVVPLSKGGTDFASNLQPLCERCNSAKGDQEIDFRTLYTASAA